MAAIFQQTLFALLLASTAAGQDHSQQQAAPEQDNLGHYAQQYVPPGDFSAYAQQWLGKQAPQRDYMNKYTDQRADYTKYMKKFGGSKADYNQYVKLYSAMAGSKPSSGADWKGKQASQMGAWQKSMNATVGGYVPGSYQSFPSQAMAARTGDGKGAGNIQYFKDANHSQSQGRDLATHSAHAEKNDQQDSQSYSQYFQKYMDRFSSGSHEDYAEQYAQKYGGDYTKFMHNDNKQQQQQLEDDGEQKVGAAELLAGASAVPSTELSARVAGGQKAANTTQLRQEAQEAVARMEALEADLHSSAKDKDATRKEAAASAEAVLDRQSKKLQQALATFTNCSATTGAAKACGHKAAEIQRQLRHEGLQGLHQAEEQAEKTASAAARSSHQRVRSLAREVRHRTDALARRSRDASDLADDLDRKAEDLAGKAERSVEELARSREEAARSQCAEAKKRLDSAVRVPDDFLAAQRQTVAVTNLLAGAPVSEEEQASKASAHKASEDKIPKAAKGQEKAKESPAKKEEQEKVPKVEKAAGQPSKEERKAQALRQKANRVVGELEHLTESFKRASRSEEVQHQAEADMGAVSELQQHDMQGVVAEFHNCSAASRAQCEGEARRRIAHLQHEAKQRLHAHSHAAAAAARRTARRAQRQVRHMAEEVRSTTDELARVDSHAADFADRTSRRAEDLASEAERHLQTLARRRSAAFEHESSKAEKMAEKYARTATRSFGFLAADTPESSSVSPAVGIALAAGSVAMAAAWAGLGWSVLARRRGAAAGVLMPEAVLG